MLLNDEFSAPGLGSLVGGLLLGQGLSFQQLFLAAGATCLSLSLGARIVHGTFAKESEDRMMRERAAEDEEDANDKVAA